MAAGGNRNKPHVVCTPGPVQSHIGAMMKLAKLLHHRGFYVTFVNTDYNHRRLLKARGPDCFLDLPDFNFVSIPDGLPSSDADATQDISALACSIRVHLPAPFFDLVSGLRCPSDPSVPPVSCLLSDGFMIFSAAPAAERLGIPLVNLWTISACSLMGFRQYRNLMEKGYTPFKEEYQRTSSYLETQIDWIPEGEARSEHVAAAVREMIQGEKGSAMRRRAARWKELAAEAVSPRGSSCVNLETLIGEIFEPKSRDSTPA
ncbi:hypothetical protein MLD38_037995 [Melastoma candidum]|uniref:Uncharacterized protein n=1 Tax=Melastoma candidum TaxID=119954 RepID=A0ACB9KXR6_9MYRT|nr:hypothetical protein MLD38_037995 [Melastoma candidum]